MNDSRSVTLHRVLTAKPSKVFKAFVDPDALARWLPPNGFTAKVHRMDARVDGGYDMSFTNFTTGTTIPFSGKYLELIEGERIRYTTTFSDVNLPGEMEVTIELKAVSVGTDIRIVQKGIPAPIPLDGCYLGWQDSLRYLAQLVEPEIPN